MWTFALRPIEVSFLAFKDFEPGDGNSYQLKLYRSKKNRFQFFSTVDQELIQDVNDHEEDLMKTPLYQFEIRYSSKTRFKKGYFMFPK